MSVFWLFFFSLFDRGLIDLPQYDENRISVQYYSEKLFLYFNQISKILFSDANSFE